ncbi:hypothetical protein JCM10212_000717 [Sporobolomyces blumeae]
MDTSIDPFSPSNHPVNLPTVEPTPERPRDRVDRSSSSSSGHLDSPDPDSTGRSPGRSRSATQLDSVYLEASSHSHGFDTRQAKLSDERNDGDEEEDEDDEDEDDEAVPPPDFTTQVPLSPLVARRANDLFLPSSAPRPPGIDDKLKTEPNARVSHQVESDRAPRYSTAVQIDFDDDDDLDLDPPHAVETGPGRTRGSRGASPYEQDSQDEDAGPDQRLLATSTSSARSSRRRPSSSALDDSRARVRSTRRGGAKLSRRDRALYLYAQITDWDQFLERCYTYYVGGGWAVICLGRFLNLLTIGWVIGFSTFLLGCVDYPKLWHADRLGDAVVPKCVSRLSFSTTSMFALVLAAYAWRIYAFAKEIRGLLDLHGFFTEVLEVPEDDIQTIPWASIVSRLSTLQATHPSSLSSRTAPSDPSASPRLDVHSVANRIMRSQNYLIALLNAPSILDFSLPVPTLFLRRVLARDRIGRDGLVGGGGGLTRALEWNLDWIVLGLAFDREGKVRDEVVSERARGELVKALRNRFILVGLLNAVFAPFIVVYLLIYSFFRYFEEYHKNPSSLSSRQFTPLALYKFRSFNELDHEFQLRLSSIRPLANLYLSSYPRAKTALISRFVAFLAGSFAAVLILFSIVDPDAFLHFEVTPGRTTLFWIGILGGVVAVARGMTPAQEGEAVRARLEPGELMKEIVELARYCPEEWEGRLHAYSVHQSFSPLFPPKPLLFLQEILSVLVTPLILLFTLPDCAEGIVDFFREFTIEVEGLGRVCSFAVFDFKNDGAKKALRQPPATAAVPELSSPSPLAAAPRTRQFSVRSNSMAAGPRFRSMENKMEKSLINFAVSNPDWHPQDEAQSLFLSQMLSDHPPPSALHLPHQQSHPHVASSLSVSSVHPSLSPGIGLAGLRSPPSSRSHSLARTGLHPRFSTTPTTVTLAEEEGDSTSISNVSNPNSLAARHRRAAEKAKFYDRAFQRSALLASTTSTTLGAGRRGPSAAVGTGTSRRFGEEPERIEEESRLDGEIFVAPTDDLPFGAGLSQEIDGRAAGGTGPAGTRLPAANLGALIGELYRR